MTNRRRNGQLYGRPPEIDIAIDAALALPGASVIARLACRHAADPNYLPSELLVHPIRDPSADKP
jgi:hypothetical protein